MDDAVNGREIVVTVSNTGGSSKGFSLVLDGELLEILKQDPLQYSLVEVMWLKTKDGTSAEFESRTAELSLQEFMDGSIKLAASFPDASIRDGIIIDDTKIFRGKAPWEDYKYSTYRFFKFTFNVKPQEGLSKLSLIVQVSPHEDWEHGSAVFKMTFWLDEEEHDEKCRKEIAAICEVLVSGGR